MTKEKTTLLGRLIIGYVDALLSAAEPPSLPQEFADDEVFLQFHEKVLVLRQTLSSFARGDLSPLIEHPGFLLNSCKTLQAHLRHVIWKVQQVERGDYSQRIDFLGDFSIAFNSMVVQLASAAETVRQKEEALTNLAVSLQEETKQRRMKQAESMQELKKSETKFRYLALHDPLTGILNRRSFIATAEAKLKSLIQLRRPGCLCMLDIDHFKKLNDTYGHTEGDQILKHVVALSLSSLRQSDLMGRYGGEEFIFFFSNADLQQGVAAAERIRLSLQNHPYKCANGAVVTVTASLGVSVVLPEWHACPLPELLQLGITLADKALYEAKGKGRNLVCASPPRRPLLLAQPKKPPSRN